jgi:hypothetical protein
MDGRFPTQHRQMAQSNFLPVTIVARYFLPTYPTANCRHLALNPDDDFVVRRYHCFQHFDIG